MNILEEMGIQAWRLRPDKCQLQDAETFQSDESITHHQSDAPLVEAPVDAPENPAQSAENEQIGVVNEEATLEGDLIVAAPTPQAEAVSWSSLAASLTDNPSCPSCASSNPILGEGNIDAAFMLVVDAPSTGQAPGQSLVAGRQGQLLDAILAAIGLSRDTIYLSSIFKCPPNSDLGLAASCGHLIHDQISLVKPKVLLTMGEFATQSLLRANETLGQLQAKEHKYPNSIKLHDCTLICTHSLGEIIDNPILKRQVWEDLKLYLELQ